MPSPTIFSYHIRDENGEPDSVPLFVSYNAVTETVGALLGAAAAYGGLIDAVTGGKLTGVDVTINMLPDPSWKTTVAADIDNQKTLLMNFNVTDTKYPQEVAIPAVKGSLIDVNGQPVIGSGAIAALIAGLAAPSGGVSVQNKFLLDITTLRDAGVTFRKIAGSLRKSKVRP